MLWVAIGLATATALVGWWMVRRLMSRDLRAPEQGQGTTSVAGGTRPFEPLNRLEELLVKAARSPEHRPKFFRALLESELFAVPAEAGTPGVYVMDRPSRRSIRSWERDGRPVIPVYTSEARVMEHLGAGTPYLAMAGRDLLESLPPTADLVLNFGAAYGKEFTSAEVRGLLDGSLLQPGRSFDVSAGTRVRMGMPAQIPEGFRETLSRLFAARRQVRAAFLVMIQFGEDEPHIAIGLELQPRVAQTEQAALLEETGMVARDALGTGGNFVDLRVLGEGATDETIRQIGQRFYSA